MRSRTVLAAAMAVAFVSFNGSASVRAQNGNGQGPQRADDQLEGTLEVRIEDGPSGSKTHHFLETANGRVRVKKHDQLDELAGLGSGTKIRARGRLNNGTLELNGNGGSVDTMALATSNTFGQQRTVVILVNFLDNQSTPYNWAQVHDVTFNQVSNFVRENSYGQTYLTGDVFGWYTIGMNAVCDPDMISSLADQAAQRAGVNLGNYTKNIYAFPNVGCGWWGLGMLGGNPGRSWINGSYELKVVAHELGHNFGDYHSRSQPCESGGCSIIEYGDDRDMMGLWGTGHFNAFQKERLGWLGYGSSPAIQTINAPGTYFISSLQTTASGPKALRVLKSSASNTFYYVEARTQTGFDSGYSAGVILHTGSASSGDSSTQIDLDPYTANFDAVLDPGQQFSDPAVNFSIRTVSVESNGAWVEIGYPGAPCTARTPTVSLSPGGTVSAAPGGTVSYVVSIRNNDDSSCTRTDFSVSMEVPSGWTWSADRTAMSLAAGATGTANVSVSAPATASGTSSLRATSSHEGFTGNSAVGYINIAAACSQAAPSVTLAPGDTVTTLPGSAVSFVMSIKNNDSSSCAGSSFAVQMEVPAGWNWSSDKQALSVSPGATSTATVRVTPPSTASGTSNSRGIATRSSGTGGASQPVAVAIQAATTSLRVSLSMVLNAGGQLVMNATVFNGSVAVPNSQLQFVVTDPRGVSTTITSTTNSVGTGTAKLKINQRSGRGTYFVLVTAVSGSATGTASGLVGY